MASINPNFALLPGSYLFAAVAKKTADYKAAHPDKKVISLGIGDVTRPLPQSVIEALRSAVDDMAHEDTFRGYGPYEGYDFLREKIAQEDYVSRGANISADEIFISDGAKSDCGNIGDIFSADNVVAVCDPVYPVYVDTNAMAGRAGVYDNAREKWTKLVYMPCTRETNFIPEIPKEHCDLIYLCFPNNPMGTMIDAPTLKKWVDYARSEGAVIFYDAAYEAYITEDLPHSIYEIEGARECAVEFRSFSKNAGFTGTRCAFCVIPHSLKVNGSSLNEMWMRRQATKFNGVPYIIQRGAEAVYSPQGRLETKALVAYFLNNAKIIRDGLSEAGFEAYGGVNAPYIWLKTKGGQSSWEFFDSLLEKAGVVGTPGSGFGPSGEGYFRLTAFGSESTTREAIKRITEAF
ncbi:MAG: LL-diaminopimelate aminotransferase [Clostridia bacterium]|nr:LL-diaminopimelate aminotransferase [Clostridia bacterium]